MPDSSIAEILVQPGCEIRCHRCSYFCGETAETVRLIGIVKGHDLRQLIAAPRFSWRCPNCGWHNVYEKA